MFRLLLALWVLCCSAAVAAPVFDQCLTTVTGSHCASFHADFHASSTDGAVVYEKLTGPGVINPVTGSWSTSGIEPGQHTLVILAVDSAGSDSCTTVINATNAGPVVQCPWGSLRTVIGYPVRFDVNATDDCDVLTMLLADRGGVTGTINLNPATGFVTYTPSEADAQLPQPVRLKFAVTDGFATSTSCEVAVTVDRPRFTVAIDRKWDWFQGQMPKVDIRLVEADTLALGGFDLLIAYDPAALGLENVERGKIFEDCGWEYFNYRIGPDGTCDDRCPCGLVRLIGIASAPLPFPPPTCGVGAVPTTLGTLTFRIGLQRWLEGIFLPIRFCWTSCFDNVLTLTDDSVQYVSTNVFDADGVSVTEIWGSLSPYAGAPEACLGDYGWATMKRGVDFVDGGISIVGSDSALIHGDLNINGVSYEPEDLQMYFDYFLHGESVFGNHVVESRVASDVNYDGVPLTASDLMLMLSMRMGCSEFIGGHKPGHYDVQYGWLSTTDTLGFLAVTIDGDWQGPEDLVGEPYDLSSAKDSAGIWHVIAYPQYRDWAKLPRYNRIWFNYTGTILSIHGATFDGREIDFNPTTVDVDPVTLPETFELAQNYPNPFNPSTTISYALPVASRVKLEIYNVAGQIVRGLVNEREAAGRHDVVWDGRDDQGESVASGVYLYRVAAGADVETKKMLLIK